MFPFRCILFGGLLSIVATVRASDLAISSEVNSARIVQWVRQLDSDEFVVRNFATDRLIAAGRPSVSAIALAMPNASLECVVRGIHILRELAVSGDSAAEAAALEALSGLTYSRVSGAAHRASASLSHIRLVRGKRAREVLRQLGAEIDSDPSPLAPFNVDKLRIGPRWTGNTEDLDHLRWLDSTYAVTLIGKQVTDRWLEIVAQLKDTQAMAIFDASITNDGLKHLRKLPKLRNLNICYCPIDDDGVSQLRQLNGLARLALFGTDITEKTAIQLGREMGPRVVDFRTGAFLGIMSDRDESRCGIQSVHPNSPAEAAGLRAGDIIIQYEGKPIGNFEMLTSLIAKNRPDDRVQISIQRGPEILKKSIALGRWEHTAVRF